MAEGRVPHCDGCAEPRKPHSPGWSVRELKQIAVKAKEGCLTCSLVQEGIDYFVADSEQPERIVLNWYMSGGKSFFARVNATLINYYITENTPLLSSTLPSWPIGYGIPGSTSSSKSMSWVLQRLEHCNDSHPACKATFHSPLPKRVLDLGDSNNPYVRLYESQGEVERYICLSHCWGAHLLIRTLSTNLLSYQDEIPWDALSLTYQETIVFVRKLRIRYLWIDSLCIIQDNEVDWRDEAANMASIYQNSYLTICAAMSANTGGGLFSNAGPEFKPHRLTYPDGDGRSQEVYARIQLSHAHFPGIYGSTPKLPIYNRGWILQERLLSPRVLHFAPQELNWECLAETVCECSCTISNVVEGPNTHHSIVDMAELSMSPKRFYSFARLSLMDKEWVERRWRKLVEEYTTLELTYERDIFPAISGLAKEFNRARKSAYFGGL